MARSQKHSVTGERIMKNSFDMRRLLGNDNNILQLLVITVIVFALMTG